MSIRVSKIQRFCLHDGNGIRTTVFLKGCPLDCPWCANPESKSFNPSLMYKKEWCVKNDKHCVLDSKCPLIHLNFKQKYAKPPLCRAIDIVGSDYSNSQLLDELKKDINFYANGGGVTFSGGEPLLQTKPLIQLFKNLHKLNINITIETSLAVSTSHVQTVLPYIDNVYVDLKTLDRKKAKKINLDLDLYLKNTQLLLSKIDKKKIIYRIPIVKGFNDSKKDINSFAGFFKTNKISFAEIFSVHNLGKEKYISMGIKYSDFPIVDTEELTTIQTKMQSKITEIKIIRL